MKRSQMRSRDRQRLRAEVGAAIAEMPIPYAIEALAKELDVSDGEIEISMRNGFLRSLVRFNRTHDVPLADGTTVFGVPTDEHFRPDRLWTRPFRPSWRFYNPDRVKVYDPIRRIELTEADPEPE
jgi:hypothetical protein